LINNKKHPLDFIHTVPRLFDAQRVLPAIFSHGIKHVELVSRRTSRRATRVRRISLGHDKRTYDIRRTYHAEKRPFRSPVTRNIRTRTQCAKPLVPNRGHLDAAKNLSFLHFISFPNVYTHVQHSVVSVISSGGARNFIEFPGI